MSKVDILVVHMAENHGKLTEMLKDQMDKDGYFANSKALSNAKYLAMKRGLIHKLFGMWVLTQLGYKHYRNLIKNADATNEIKQFDDTTNEINAYYDELESKNQKLEEENASLKTRYDDLLSLCEWYKSQYNIEYKAHLKTRQELNNIRNSNSNPYLADAISNVADTIKQVSNVLKNINY